MADTSLPNAMVEEFDGSNHERPKLFPSLSMLGAFNLLAGVIAHLPVALAAVVLLSTGYLGVIILKTRDMVSEPHRLHPTDRWVCRKSGMLSAALAFALIVGAGVSVAVDMEPEDIGLKSPRGLPLVGFIMEIGVVLSVACLWGPRDLRHVRPVVFWKAVNVPLLLIYGAYVVLLLMAAVAPMAGVQP